MTGTSKTLKRLGVAGLSATLITVGLGATAVGAFAAPAPTPATAVTLDKHSDTAAVGTCNAFTATVTPASSATPAQLTVNIQEAVPSNTAAGVDGGAGEHIGFCDPLAANPDAAGTPAAGPGTQGANTTAGTHNDCYNTAATDSTHTSNVSCNNVYTDTNGDGKITFGVTSNTPGTMSVNAFGDTNGNGAQDLNTTPKEPGDQATKTWVADNTTLPAAQSNKVSCTPTSAQNPTSTVHKFTCTATDANGVALSGQQVNFIVKTGPDAGTGWTTAGGGSTTSSSGTPPLFSANASCTATTNTGAGGTTAGTATCQYTNNTQPGHDVIDVWLESNNTVNQQAGEPTTEITKDWVQASANGAQVTVSCSPNQTGTEADVKANDSGVCQQPLTGKTFTVTAKVVNGTPAAGQAGALVQWAITFDSEDPSPGHATDSKADESLSANSCTTAADGTCSITVTNSAPTNDEEIFVEATVTRQDTTQDFAGADLYWHNPDSNESRVVTVTPSPATQPSGGVQTLTAMVVDRFNNPVKGADLDWSETGPGAFRGGANTAFCTTDATGKCSEDVASLTTESGDETVTVTLDDGNFNDGQPKAECNSPAGFSNFSGTSGTQTPSNAPYYNNTGTTPNANGQNNVATGAAAGVCAASAKVTWQTGQQNGSVQITSFTNNNPAACSAFTVSGTAPSGATVTLTGFNFRQGTFTIGTATAGSNGAWTFSGSGICFNTTVTASTGSGAGATNSNTVTLGFHQVFTNVHFTRVGPYRRGLIEYNVSGSSTSIIGGEPIRVQNGACRSDLCGITHMRSSGFDRLHIYLLPGTYTLVLYGTGGSDAQFGGDGHQYTNPQRQSFTVTIH